MDFTTAGAENEQGKNLLRDMKERTETSARYFREISLRLEIYEIKTTEDPVKLW